MYGYRSQNTAFLVCLVWLHCYQNMATLLKVACLKTYSFVPMQTQLANAVQRVRCLWGQFDMRALLYTPPSSTITSSPCIVVESLCDPPPSQKKSINDKIFYKLSPNHYKIFQKFLEHSSKPNHISDYYHLPAFKL